MKQKVYLAPDIILRLIINEKDSKFTNALYKSKKHLLVTSGFCWWEVLSCLTKEEIKDNAETIVKLLKTIKNTDIIIEGKPTIESKERIEHLRKLARIKE